MAAIAETFRTRKFDHVVEDQIAKVPSDTFIVLGLGAIAVALGARLAGRRDAGDAIGLLAPVFMALAVYDKLSKR